VGREGRDVGAAGRVGGARRGEGDAGAGVGVGPADRGAGAPGGGRVPDALRVELAAGGGGGRRADADVPAGVRPVHRGEAGDGGPQDRGPRSTWCEERMVVPAEAVARAVATFLEPGSAGEARRTRARELAAKANAAVAEGGSSYRDLHRLIDDLIEARSAAAGGTTSLSAGPLHK
jgi:hypothetical protein